jgi:hypothetical protein
MRNTRADTIRNVIGTVSGAIQNKNTPAQLPPPPPKTDYTPIIIGGVVSIVVALIISSRK